MITGSGPKPLSFGKLPSGPKGELQTMKNMEEVTIEAAVTGDYGKALEAFMVNPLIKGGHIAQELLNEMLLAHEEYLPQFKESITKLKEDK